jgi:acetyl esterase/lipase
MGTAASRNGGGSSSGRDAAAANSNSAPPQQQHQRTLPATSVPLGADGRPLGTVDQVIDDEEEDDGGGGGGPARAGVGPLGALRQGYAALVDAIIRPPRAHYSVDDLGPAAFSFRGRAHERVDFTLTNPRGETLQVSRWGAVAGGDDVAPLPPVAPAVVYLHGNSSCRLGALEALETLLALGVAVVAFDASGSGLSGGEYVTLGHRERDDLAAVVGHLRCRGDCSTIGLWGRSMGASTALLHVHRDPSIAALVLDSPFADLKQLALELVDAGRTEAGLR